MIRRAAVATGAGGAVLLGVLAGAVPAQAEEVDRVEVPVIQAQSTRPAAPGVSSSVRIPGWTAPDNNRILKTVLHWGTTKDERECAGFYDEIVEDSDEVPLVGQVVYANLPTVNMDTFDIAPPLQVGGGLPQSVDETSQPVRWKLENAGGYMCVFTEMQYFVRQGTVVKKAFSAVGFATGTTAFVQGSEIAPLRPGVPSSTTSVRPGDIDVSAALSGSPRLDERIESRDLIVSFLPADRRTDPCASVPDARRYGASDFATITRNIIIPSAAVGSYLCLQQEVTTDWMNETRRSAKRVIPVVASPGVGLSRLFAASANLAAALQNVELIQQAPAPNAAVLAEAVRELEQAQAEAEQARVEAQQQDPAVQQQEAAQNGDPAAAIAEVEELVKEATVVTKDGRQQAEAGARYIPLSAALAKALRTTNAPLVSTSGVGTYRDATLRIKAPGKHKRGTKKVYRASFTPKTTGQVSFALVRRADSGREIVAATKVAKLNKKGQKTLRWKLPKKMSKGGYTLYVSVKPAKSSGKAPFTVARTLQVR